MGRRPIPIQGLNEIKAHEPEADAVDRQSMRKPNGEVQRKDHSKHCIGMTIWESFSGVPTYTWHRIFCSLMENTALGLVFFVALYFVQTLGLPLSQTGLIISAYGLGTAVGGVIAGRLSDRYSPTLISLFSLILQSLMILSLAHLKTFLPLSMTLFGFGLASYGFKTSNNYWVLNQASSTAIKLKLVGLLYIASNLGIGLSALGVSIWAQHSFNTIFYLSAGILMIAAIYLWKVKNFNIPKLSQEKSPIKPIEPSSSLPPKNYSFFIILTMLICLFLTGLVVAQLSTTYGIFLEKHFPAWGIHAVSITFIINTVLIIVLQNPLLHLLRKANLIRLVGWGCFLYAVGMGLLSIAPVFAYAVIACVIRTFGEMLFYSMAQLVCYQNAPLAHRGLVMGLFQSTFATSIIIGPTIGALIYQSWGPHILWNLCSLLGIICLIFCYICNHWTKHFFKSNSSSLLN